MFGSLVSWSTMKWRTYVRASVRCHGPFVSEHLADDLVRQALRELSELHRDVHRGLGAWLEIVEDGDRLAEDDRGALAAPAWTHS